MLAFSHSLEKHCFSKQFLNRTDKGFAIEVAHNFIIGIDIRYFIVSIGLAWIQRFNNLDDIICTEFKSRQFLFSCKRYIRWNRTIVIYCPTLLTKIIVKQICSYQKVCYKLISNKRWRY